MHSSCHQLRLGRLTKSFHVQPEEVTRTHMSACQSHHQRPWGGWRQSERTALLFSRTCSGIKAVTCLMIHRHIVVSRSCTVFSRKMFTQTAMIPSASSVLSFRRVQASRPARLYILCHCMITRQAPRPVLLTQKLRKTKHGIDCTASSGLFNENFNEQKILLF